LPDRPRPRRVTIHAITSLREEHHEDACTVFRRGFRLCRRGDTPNRHDILTGSLPDGTAAEQTCEDWTSSGDGSAMVGHHDRMGLDDTPPSLSWNASHPSRGCSLEALQGTGGDGLLYCFAVN
jgi:hypothetical protein